MKSIPKCSVILSIISYTRNKAPRPNLIVLIFTSLEGWLSSILALVAALPPPRFETLRMVDLLQYQADHLDFCCVSTTVYLDLVLLCICRNVSATVYPLLCIRHCVSATVSTVLYIHYCICCCSSTTSVRNGPGRTGPDVFRPGLWALYQAWPAALSAGCSGEKPGWPGSPSRPSDWLLFPPACATHIENVIEPWYHYWLG